jgi:DNA invertase Pin-like site-specific DNA recombinase
MNKPTTNAKVGVAYMRVSTGDQTLGLDAQRSAIEVWARREGVQVVAWCVDEDVCGATPIDERQGLCEAFAAQEEHGAGIIVVAKRDRLARDIMLTLVVESQLQKRGARIVSAAGEGTDSDEPSAQLMRGIIDLFAQYERAVIRSRTKAALDAKKARGERLGACPFGMRRGQDGALERDEGEARTVARILELSREGGTLRSIASTLAKEGYLSRRNTPLTITQIQRILANKSHVSHHSAPLES